MQPALPQSVAGRVAEKLLRDFSANALDDQRWMRWRQLVGPVALRGVEELPRGGVRVWVQGTVSRAWLGWELTPDSTGAVDVTRAPVFWLGAAAPPALASEGALEEDANVVRARVMPYLDALGGADLFSGVVLVARNGKPIVERAYGFANGAYEVKNTFTTRFSVASLGKVFTALAVARLVAAAKLRYDDPISKFLPDYPVVEARSATVGQLLAHQAGLGASPLDWIAMREQLTLAELVRLTAVAQQFPAGTSTQYSNEGYLVAGRIVEVVAAEPYDTFVKREVFAPAGMTDTDWDTIDQAASRRAVPYSNWRFRQSGGQVFVPGPRRDVTYMQGLRGTPAGGAYTTAADLLALANALVGGQLIDSDGLALMTAPRGATPGGRTSYGFELGTSPRRASKGGNAQGVSAQLDLYLDDGYTVVVLSNYDQAAQVAAHGISDLLRSERGASRRPRGTATRE
jgi:CubicO group peptidase (beta-lactamase class C family)